MAARVWLASAARLMTFYLFFTYLLNWLAPAAALAWLMAVLAPRWPLLRGARPWVLGWPARFLWGFGLNTLVLLAGLLLGATGKMYTYGALLTVSALAQFVMLGLWRR